MYNLVYLKHVLICNHVSESLFKVLNKAIIIILVGRRFHLPKRTESTHFDRYLSFHQILSISI